MNELDFNKHRKIADNLYSDANCKYDGNEYIYHIDMVINCINNHKNIFKYDNDYINTVFAGFYHDVIEDAKISYNNIKEHSNEDIANITLAVTDVPEENRLLRHLATMNKTVKDHRAIILKMCDVHANASYSKKMGNAMYKKYVEEYYYRRPIFKKALNWYKDKLNMDVVDNLWNELDDIHEFKMI
ncbi:MAG: hypothetical protein ACOC22_03215 [bacterium]